MVNKAFFHIKFCPNHGVDLFKISYVGMVSGIIVRKCAAHSDLIWKISGAIRMLCKSVFCFIFAIRY